MGGSNNMCEQPATQIRQQESGPISKPILTSLRMPPLRDLAPSKMQKAGVASTKYYQLHKVYATSLYETIEGSIANERFEVAGALQQFRVRRGFDCFI
jgi:hypothetical protein